MRIIFLQLSHTFWDLICCIQDDQSRCIFLGQEKVTETISSILFPLLSWSHASITRNTRGIFEMEAKKNKLFVHFLKNQHLCQISVMKLYCENTLHKNWSFPLRILSVNVTKSAGNCGFGHIYWRNR